MSSTCEKWILELLSKWTTLVNGSSLIELHSWTQKKFLVIRVDTERGWDLVPLDGSFRHYSGLIASSSHQRFVLPLNGFFAVSATVDTVVAT